MPGIAWVLGAGFSRSLGGPLIQDLFSEASARAVNGVYPDSSSDFRFLRDEAATGARGLYAKFGPGAGGQRPPRPQRWADAEEFLDALDTAAQSAADSPARAALREFGVRDPDATSAAARRLLAAECCSFLRVAESKTETWEPYVRWARLLEPVDTLITFNYDLVVETAMDRAGRAGDLHVALPQEATSPPEEKVPLFKLHGSVDWRFTGATHRLYERGAADFAVRCQDPKQMVIASPGPAKMASTRGPLRNLWEQALSRMASVAAVVFVGYRFPPSDSVARRELLAAISGIRGSQLSIHTVLGEDTEDKATRRLAGLLASAGRQWERLLRARTRNFISGPQYKSLKRHPLFAEDFLDVFERDQLPGLPGPDF